MLRSGYESMTRLSLKGSVSFNPWGCVGLHTGRGFGDLLISRGFARLPALLRCLLYLPNRREIELFRSQRDRAGSASCFVRPQFGMASSLETSPVGRASEEFVANL